VDHISCRRLSFLASKRRHLRQCRQATRKAVSKNIIKYALPSSPSTRRMPNATRDGRLETALHLLVTFGNAAGGHLTVGRTDATKASKPPPLSVPHPWRHPFLHAAATTGQSAAAPGYGPSGSVPASRHSRRRSHRANGRGRITTITVEFPPQVVCAGIHNLGDQLCPLGQSTGI
jgi:hypothetical protein